VVNRNLARYMGILDRKPLLLRPLLQPGARYRSCHNACRLAEPGTRVGSSYVAVARLAVVGKRVSAMPGCVRRAGSAWVEKAMLWGLRRLDVDQNLDNHLECALDYGRAGLAPAVDIARTPSFV
jgi:hypothetical protein